MYVCETHVDAPTTRLLGKKQSEMEICKQPTKASHTLLTTTRAKHPPILRPYTDAEPPTAKSRQRASRPEGKPPRVMLAYIHLPGQSLHNSETNLPPKTPRFHLFHLCYPFNSPNSLSHHHHSSSSFSSSQLAPQPRRNPVVSILALPALFLPNQNLNLSLPCAPLLAP